MDLTLPFRRYRLKLRLLHAARLHFRHEVMSHSLLSEALGRGELPESVIPFACESGRVDFARDDDYRIGFTVVGEGPERFMEHLARALGAYGARGFQGERIPMLRWFGAGEPEALPAPDLDAECHALAGRSELVLQFVSPLRLEVPKGANGRGTELFDARHFPAEAFLRLLWNRLFFLREGRFPHRDEITLGMPPLPTIACDPRKLLWIDVPRVHKPPLGGVVGRLILQNLGEHWLPLLVAGQYLHLGKSTGFGFGAYRIAGDAPLWNDPFGPSQTALERVAQRERLTAAARHVVAATAAAGVDATDATDLAARHAELAAALSSELADGSYRPAPLLGVLLPDGRAGMRPLAVPALTDQILQHATAEVLGNALDCLLNDSALPCQHGFSCATGPQAVEAERSRGYRSIVERGPASLDPFLARADREQLLVRLESLWPFDPLTALICAWLAAPVVFDRALMPRPRGLPTGAILSPLLATLILDTLGEQARRAGLRLVRHAEELVLLAKEPAAGERSSGSASSPVTERKG